MVALLAIVLLACQSESLTNLNKSSVRITCNLAGKNGTGSNRLNDCGLSGAKSEQRDSIDLAKNLELKIIGNGMNIRFYSPIMANAIFDLDEPMQMDDVVAKKLGYNKIIIEPGTYRVQTDNSGSFLNMEVETE